MESLARRTQARHSLQPAWDRRVGTSQRLRQERGAQGGRPWPACSPLEPPLSGWGRRVHRFLGEHQPVLFWILPLGCEKAQPGPFLSK